MIAKKKRMLSFIKHSVAVGCIAVSLVVGFAAFAAADNMTTVVNSSYIDMSRPTGSCASYTKILAIAGDDTICTVNGVKGKFEGGGEYGVVRQENGVWVFRGNSCQPAVGFWVSCFRSEP
jgi:hypothetical protein